jgi:hypothetical protein
MVMVLVPGAQGDGEVGIISGRVFDSASLLPLSGAMVVLDGNSTMWMTGHNGDYAIPDVLLGIHRVRAFIDGYDAKSYELNLSGPSATQDIYLEPSTAPVIGALRGSIVLERTYGETDADDAAVIIKDLDRTEIKEVVIDVTGSGLSGEYSASVLPGNISVQGLAYGHMPSIPVDVLVLPGSVSYLDIVLRTSKGTGTVLKGTVRDASSGAPVGNATVVARCKENGMTYSFAAGPSGEYFFSGPAMGEYIVVAFGSGYHSGSGAGEVDEGSPTTIDIELDVLDDPSERSSFIWGLISSDGSPSTDAWAFTSMGSHMKAGLHGIDGLYLFEGMDGLKHRVGAWASDRYAETVSLDVPAGSAVRQDFHLGRMENTSQGSSLVLLQVTDGSAENVHLGGASVTLFKTDRSTGMVERSRTLDLPLDGTMGVLFPVPSDSNYRVRAVLNGHILENLTVDGRPEVLLPDDGFLILGNRLNALELRMSRTNTTGPNCTLWGFAASDILGGRPVPGAAVFLNRGHNILSYTDEAGIYEFQVTPGEVDLLAAYPGSYGHSAYDHSSGEWQVGDFQGTMGNGETRRVDLVFQVRNTEDSTIAGRIVDHGTGDGVQGFDVSIRTTETAMPEQRTGPGGLFHFTPVKDLVRPWRVLGGSPGYRVVRVDRRAIPDGPTTTGIDFPFELTVAASTLVWIDIYVEKRSPEELAQAVLWGFVRKASTSGAPVQGAYVSLSPSIDGQNFTDEDGSFSLRLTPGSYEMTTLIPGISSMFNHDLASDTWSQGPWSGALRAGEERRVDIVLNTGDEGTSTIAGRVLLGDGSLVDGFRLKARTLSGSMPTVISTNGRFMFSPISDLDGPWTISGDSAEHMVTRVEHRVLPGTVPSVQASLPLTYQVPAGSVLWVDVFVNMTSSVKDGHIVGQVLEPYSYRALEAVTVLVSSDMDGDITVRTTISGSDGTFELYLPAGAYQLKLVKDGYSMHSIAVEIGNGQELIERFFLVPDGTQGGKATLFRFLDSVKGTPVKELKVQIGGIGAFVTDEDGQVRIEIPFSGNYTFTVSGSVEGIESVASGNITFGTDGTLRIAPGDEYIFTMRPYVQKGTEKGSGMNQPLLIGLIAGILIALVVGLIIGLLISRRPKEMAFFEE